MSLLQAAADQRIAGKDQALAQGRSDMIEKLCRRRPGAAFGPVNDDEIGALARLDHGLANGEKLPAIANAEFEPDRFAARQVPQLIEKIEQALGAVKGGMMGGEKQV